MSVNILAEPIPLWSGDMPVKSKQPGQERYEDERVYNVRVPEIIPYLAAKNNASGAAVLIFPGGGYEKLSIVKEGKEIANWLNSLGVSAFIVKYRLQEFGHPAPLMDGLRAIQIVRSKASEWNIDPHKIGVLGFSAGGHLASSVATHYDQRDYLYGDLTSVAARPDFMILLYPVITFSDPYAHQGSVEALLGEKPAADLIEFYSNEIHVNINTPPTFLMHSSTDESVPMENSMKFYTILRQAKVPVEMHIYQNAEHGFGMREGQGPASEWPALCEQWLRLNRYIN
ncbi:MAG: alpha/beta hydrolase [Gammaproteobacteria bacterium]|nr:alpha/beta hydrolase [Gammaproteobacteria bacterium]